MPVFLQGRRAFLSSLRRRHRRCNPLSVHRVTDSGLAYPRRAYSCFTYSCRASPAAAAACHSYSHLASPAAAACHSYPHLASPAAAAFGYRSAARTATPPAWSEMPPRPAHVLLPSPKRRHGPRPFCCSARGPRPGARGTKKGGRNRTEARPPPKSNQSVAAASPRQVIWLSGKSPFLKVGIRTPGNTRSSPAPKRTVFRYRAALRKVHHQANKATSRRSRTDN